MFVHEYPTPARGYLKSLRQEPGEPKLWPEPSAPASVCYNIKLVKYICNLCKDPKSLHNRDMFVVMVTPRPRQYNVFDYLTSSLFFTRIQLRFTYLFNLPWGNCILPIDNPSSQDSREHPGIESAVQEPKSSREIIFLFQPENSI